MEEEDNLRCKVIQAVSDIWKETGKQVSLRTTGKSMWPMIRAGEEIIVDCVNSPQLRRGEIGAFRLPGSVIVHRIVAVEDRGAKIYERGDNNMYISVADRSQLLGRVLEIRSGTRVFRLERPAWRAIGLFACYWGLAAVRIYGRLRALKNLFGAGRGGGILDLSRRLAHSFLLIPPRIVIICGRLFFAARS